MNSGFYADFDASGWGNASTFEARALRAIEGTVVSYSRKANRHMQRLFKEPKSGNVYLKDDGGLHVASAPGEAPAIWTGNLSRSINDRYFRKGMGRFVSVGPDDSNVPYAEKLEYGRSRRPTRDREQFVLLQRRHNGSKNAPRPFALPTAEALRRDFEREVLRAVLVSIMRRAF